MHEYAHVVQYYYLDIEHGTQQSLDDASSLGHDFSISTGWTAKRNSSDPYLSGSDITFAPEEIYRRWKLPETEERGTTKYGKTKNVEDQAESIGWVVAGHPAFVSDARVARVENFLGEEIETFTKGVIPVHPRSLRSRGHLRGTKRFFQDREPDGFVIGAENHEPYLFFKDEGGVSFQDAARYFSNAFAARGFNPIAALKYEVLEKKEDYASGIYAFEGRQVLLQIFDLTSADAYITKGDMTVRMVLGVQE